MELKLKIWTKSLTKLVTLYRQKMPLCTGALQCVMHSSCRERERERERENVRWRQVRADRSNVTTDRRNSAGLSPTVELPSHHCILMPQTLSSPEQQTWDQKLHALHCVTVMTWEQTQSHQLIWLATHDVYWYSKWQITHFYFIRLWTARC